MQLFRLILLNDNLMPTKIFCVSLNTHWPLYWVHPFSCLLMQISDLLITLQLLSAFRDVNIKESLRPPEIQSIWTGKKSDLNPDGLDCSSENADVMQIMVQMKRKHPVSRRSLDKNILLISDVRGEWVVWAVGRQQKLK